jgi:hypothetical protein
MTPTTPRPSVTMQVRELFDLNPTELLPAELTVRDVLERQRQDKKDLVFAPPQAGPHACKQSI